MFVSLCYLLTGATLISYHVVLSLSRTFSTFLIFFFAIWPEVLSIFFVEAFVLRRFLNSEVYNTIVLFVCQQLFLIFFRKKKRPEDLPHRASPAASCLIFLSIYKVVSFALNPMARISSVVSHMQFLFSSGNPIPPVSPAKSPEICPAYHPEVLLVFSENQTFWSGFHPVSVICLSFPSWFHCLISCAFLPSYPPKNNVKFS